MTYAGWHLGRLWLSGKDGKEAVLNFSPQLTLIYGASNTGKSFAVKAIDFMLGGNAELPRITERNPYDKVWLGLSLAPSYVISFERGAAGGAFTLHDGDRPPKVLAPKHASSKPDSLSAFLLSEMGANGKKIAVDQSGTQESLSFRDYARIVLTNELAIQSESSPIESGDKTGITRTRERNVLKFLLTGQDDSAVTPVVKPKDFRTGQTAKRAILQELIDATNGAIAKDYPDPAGLADQHNRLNDTLREIEAETDGARSSLKSLLQQKRSLFAAISNAERRRVDVSLSLESFEQLERVYDSDIERLGALEEAGFLLSLNGARDCPVCGAPPTAQVHTHGLVDIENVRVAAEREVLKVQQQRDELREAQQDATREADRLDALAGKLREALQEVERLVEKATPLANEQDRRLGDIITVRDRVRRGLELLERRDSLVAQQASVTAERTPKPTEDVQRGLSTEVVQEFADVVGDVLSQWGFPGKNRVTFDLEQFDLIIDGKERRNNGKGVRAITHAAFKVGLLLFCRERDLPHPGFIVLDTPLLTYRDPMRGIGDALAPDEEALRQTNLKQRFYEHLGRLGERAQVIVLENSDPPSNIRDYALVEAFTNDPTQGRQGFL